MFWTALCLSLSGSPLLHQCLQKVNKARADGHRGVLVWENLLCCGKRSVRRLIRNAFVPGSASYSGNWLPPMFLTISSTFTQTLQGRKPVFCSHCLHQFVVCYLISSFYLSSGVKGSLGHCSYVWGLLIRLYDEKGLSRVRKTLNLLIRL